MTSGKRIFLPLALFLFFSVCFAESCHAYSIVVSEKTRGEYQNGTFTPSPVLYQYSFDINERARKVRLIQTRRLKDSFTDPKMTEYEILSIDNKTRNGVRQKVMVFVKDDSSLSRETFILGETFFEYCKSASDHFFLSSGDVSVSVALRKGI